MQIVEGIGQAEGRVGRLCSPPSEWWLECGSGKGNENKWIGFGIVRKKKSLAFEAGSLGGMREEKE